MAVEVGGTFTDLIWLDERRLVEAWKVPSTPEDPSGGVINGLEEALGERLREIAMLAHGSTVATNAVLERRGCHAGLLTTRGFRDILLTQRQLRDNVYSIVSAKPEPIVPAGLTAEVTERLTVHGDVQTPLDETELVETLDWLVRERTIEALAVCLLHSYRNPVHEQRVREITAERYPQLPVVLSSEVLPAFREYERASTAAMAAYLAPLVGRYLSRLEDYLREGDVDAPLFVMQSAGGVLPSSAIRSRPVEMLQSGPAAGVIAAIRVAERLGDPDLITLDMGGTSTDVCLVRGGQAEISSERTLDGLPIGIPSIDIANVGAGGGSLAWLDRGGMLQVGPRSAGARPGPACYGFGSSEPAITDALVQLGWMRPDHFLGGRMPLYPERATAALSGVAGAIGHSTAATAQAMIDIAVAHINSAVRLVSVQRGHDPQRYALYAYGGMGPVVGALVAQKMGVTRVVVPPHPGLFSALGLLVADLERSYRQTSFLPLSDAALPELLATIRQLQTQAETEFASYGYSPEQVETHAQLEMRYRGQGFELLVPVDPVRLERMGAGALIAAFHATHAERYGTRAPSDAVEVVTYRLSARVPGGREALDRLHDQAASGNPEVMQADVTFRGERQPCRFLRRESLPLGYITGGLSIIEEATATTLVPPGWRLTVRASGALVLEREGTA